MKDHPVRNSIYNVYFSPTKATQKIAYEVADAIAADRDLTSIAINLTKPKSRPVRAGGQENDVFLFAFPVYSGRVPAVLMDCIDQFEGDGAKAVVVGVYGNRHYDDALLEAADLLSERGFKVIAAGAFIGEHSMAPRVGAGRPDADDLPWPRSSGTTWPPSSSRARPKRPPSRATAPTATACLIRARAPRPRTPARSAASA